MKFKSLILIFISSVSFAQKNKITPQKVWVDSVYNQMSFDERVGQLFMVAAYSNRDEKHVNALLDLVKNQNIGGVIFFQGGPVRQAKITNKLNANAKLPLFVGIDAEWGLGMRLDSTYVYPWNMNLGAIQDMSLIEMMGRQMGEQAKRIGVHFNFAPVVDININPKNPVIGNRSFGESKENVSERAIALVKGIQSQNVFATAKHFPGHGDTSTDSHHALPHLDFSKTRMTDVELYPYRKLIKNGLASIMVAHLDVPSLEPEKGVPTSLSYNTITTLLKDEMGFEGLIFTDALNMKGASNFKSPGDIDVAAFIAGNDVLLFAENVPLAIEKFHQAYAENKFTDKRLEESVKKILAYKYQAGLNNYKPIEIKNLYEDLNQPKYDLLSEKLYENMMTLIKNEKRVLPLKADTKIAYVKLGDDVASPFEDELKRRVDVEVFYPTTIGDNGEFLKEYDKVIIGYHKADGVWKKHELTAKEIETINKIAKDNKTVLVSFARPYALSTMNNFDNVEAVLLAYQNNKFGHKAAIQALFGEKDIDGKLPVSLNSKYAVNDGIDLSASSTEKDNIKNEFKHKRFAPVRTIPETEDIALVRYNDLVQNPKDEIVENKIKVVYSTPEAEGLNTKKLAEIDKIAEKAIANRNTPGIQVLVARNGKVVFDKSYGYQTYNKKGAVTNETVYDLASLSKILGTLPMVMKLYEDKQIKFEDKLGDLLPRFKNTDKENITLKEILTHQSGFPAWIPFYKETLENGKPSDKFYRKTFSKDYPIQVSENLYLKAGYENVILDKIKDSKLGDKTYKYSDLNFILLKEIVETKYNKPLDVLVEETFYKPLNIGLTYNPLQKMDMSKIAPSELDTYYRNTLIQGYVHDMGAAMFGGVAGHAGLFGTSTDVFKMMQFYLDAGLKNNSKILSAKTLNDFNTCYYCEKGNRRGAGFDKPQLGNSGPTCGCTSSSSYGHTGFTGTMTWVDPEYDLVYVFLSNRTYPNADENKLSKANVREDIQKVIYESIKK
ncbi:glycoside hydrolase family 3 N-terminal domain-containing protein [Flavobacterium sp. I3-2]|uniref:glycoside hydrolase family 3 N-terminal domain-containing protein n=1 Tax=Flavobacterium sp. I3-2 TaxID=2748319 RepID=UPI002103DE99|nr:glycoside hydrolase family 3 N-terminal domain-containing protein [Flavobacterium sp. I3-2]